MLNDTLILFDNKMLNDTKILNDTLNQENNFDNNIKFLIYPKMILFISKGLIYFSMISLRSKGFIYFSKSPCKKFPLFLNDIICF